MIENDGHFDQFDPAPSYDDGAVISENEGSAAINTEDIISRLQQFAASLESSDSDQLKYSNVKPNYYDDDDDDDAMKDPNHNIEFHNDFLPTNVVTTSNDTSPMVDKLLFALRDDNITTPVNNESTDDTKLNKFHDVSAVDEDVGVTHPEVPLPIVVTPTATKSLVAVTPSTTSSTKSNKSNDEDDIDLSPAPRNYYKSYDPRVQCDFTVYQRGDIRLSSQGIRETYSGLYETALASKTHYSILVLECIIRPDKLLMEFMNAVSIIGNEYQLKYGMVASSHVVLTPIHPEGRGVWYDHIDVQVCVSKELKQRILLFQFICKTPSDGHHYYPNLTNVTNSPIIKFIESVKNSLDSFHLCISSLYSSPNVCKNGLDNDFKVKLHALCRELMWDSLKKDFASMDEHVQLVEVQCAKFISTIEVIYKAHGLHMPSAKPRRKYADFPLPIDLAALDNVSGIEREVDDDDEEEEEEEEMEVKEVVKRLDVAPAVVQTQHRNSVSKLNQLYTLGELAASSPDNVKAASVVDIALEDNRNGMEICLDMMSHCLSILHKRCDKELSARLQQKNEYTVAIITDIQEYRRSLLIHIGISNEAYKSVFNRQYLDLFNGVPEMIPPVIKRENATPTKQSTDIIMDDYLSGEVEAAQPVSGGVVTPTKTIHSSENLVDSIKTWWSGGKSTPSSTPSMLTSESKKGIIVNPDIMKKRLNEYRSQEYIPSTSPKTTIGYFSYDTVLYYCNCMVSSIPGKLFLTTKYIALVYGVLGINTTKELYSLASLDEVLAPERNASMLTSNTLKLSFFGGLKYVYVSPIVIECQRLRSIVIDAKSLYL